MRRLRQAKKAMRYTNREIELRSDRDYAISTLVDHTLLQIPPYPHSSFSDNLVHGLSPFNGLRLMTLNTRNLGAPSPLPDGGKSLRIPKERTPSSRLRRLAVARLCRMLGPRFSLPGPFTLPILLFTLLALSHSAYGAEETALPSKFQSMSTAETYYACSVFFYRSVQFEVSALKLEPRNKSFQRSLRDLLTMKTHVLLLNTEEVLDERRRTISGDLSSEVNEESGDVLTYCVAMSNSVADQLNSRLRSIVAGIVNDEYKTKLASVRSRQRR